MKLVLAGASLELKALAESLGHEVIAVVDPALADSTWHGLPVALSDAEGLARFGPKAIALAIDDPAVRRRVQHSYAASGVGALSLLAGLIGITARVGCGAVVQRFAHLSEGCIAGDGLRLNVGANVMHDCVLGDFVTVAPNAVVLGGVTIGPGSYIGANATILPGVRIGARCRIGAGAVVTRDVNDELTVKGVPAR